MNVPVDARHEALERRVLRFKHLVPVPAQAFGKIRSRMSAAPPMRRGGSADWADRPFR
jgi:hypothetical protein